jgi:hypothetical protein
MGKASQNADSVNRLTKMNRITANGALSLVRDNIIDGSGLTVTAPAGTVDGQKLSWTWEFGSDFTLSGAWQTTAGDDAEITFAATDKPVLVTAVWNAAASKWSI